MYGVSVVFVSLTSGQLLNGSFQTALRWSFTVYGGFAYLSEVTPWTGYNICLFVVVV